MQQLPPATIFETSLSDEYCGENAVAIETAQKIFTYFKNAVLFRWGDANNDCEDRANAISILLDEWGIVNCKAWVFSGYFLKNETGDLHNRWNYHVAAALPVQVENKMGYYVIDPATCPAPTAIETWALQITECGNSYHFVKDGSYYIFPGKKIEKDNWHKRNKRNYNWTMQGLTGINGKSSKGKAQLVFHKGKVKKTEERFKNLIKTNPIF